MNLLQIVHHEHLTTSQIAQGVFLGFLSIMAYFNHRHAKSAAKDAGEANDAVNHKHKDQPKIYDLALENRIDIKEMKANVNDIVEWKAGYGDGDWSTGEGVKRWQEQYNKDQKKLRDLIRETAKKPCGHKDCPRTQEKSCHH